MASRIEELERRVRQDPASIAFGALAEEYRRSGRLEDAVETCRTGLSRHPSYLSARVTLGRALQELGQLADARAEYEYVLSIAPDNLAAIRGLAELHGEPDAPAAAPEPAPIAVAEPAPVPEPVKPVEPVEPAEPVEPVDPEAALRAAQIERLEIWLARLDDARRS